MRHITQLLAGSTEIRLGSIDPTRDFKYVEDTVDGFLAIAETQATKWLQATSERSGHPAF